MIDAVAMLSHEKLIENFERKKEFIIEAFVLYYGENHRSYIEKKFQDVKIVFYHSPKQKQNIIKRSEESIRRKYAREFLSELGFDVMNIEVDKIDEAIKNTPEIARYFEICFGHPSSVWMFDQSAPIYAFDGELGNKLLLAEKYKKNIIEYFTSYKIESVENFLNNPNNIPFFAEIENQLSLLNDLRMDFNQEIESTIGNIREKVKRELEREQLIKSNIQEQLFSCINDTLKFNAQYRNLVDSLNMNTHRPRANKSVSDFVCSLDDNNFKGLLSFDPFYDKIVNDSSIPEIMKRNIIKERKIFLNDLGVCLPLDSPYEDFEMRMRELEIVIPKDIIFVVGKIREIFVNRLASELYGNSEILQIAKKNLKNPNQKQIDEICGVIANELNCIKVHTKLVKTADQSIQIYISPFGNLCNYSDVTFVHELVHFLQIFFEEEKSKVDSQFNYYKIGLLEYEPESKENSVELLNEYLTQKTAVEVTRILHEKLGTKIFEFENENYLQNFCKYEIFDLILSDFHSKFHEEIKRATITGNSKILLDALQGRDCFDSICRITNKFADFFYHVEENGLELLNIVSSAQLYDNDINFHPENFLSQKGLKLFNQYISIAAELSGVLMELLDCKETVESEVINESVESD